jgi:hypothetical protein
VHSPGASPRTSRRIGLEGVDTAFVGFSNVLNQNGLDVRPDLLPNIEIVLRQPLGNTKQVLPLIIALRPGKERSDYVKRRLDIDIAKIHQAVGHNIHNAVNRDARKAPKWCLFRFRLRQSCRVHCRDKLILDFGVDGLEVAVVRQDVVAKPSLISSSSEEVARMPRVSSFFRSEPGSLALDLLKAQRLGCAAMPARGMEANVVRKGPRSRLVGS